MVSIISQRLVEIPVNDCVAEKVLDSYYYLINEVKHATIPVDDNLGILQFGKIVQK